MPDWIDNRALWEMTDQGPKFLAGLNAGANVGRAWLQAREQALMLPLQKAHMENAIKQQDLASQQAVLGMKRESMLMDFDTQKIPLEIKRLETEKSIGEINLATEHARQDDAAIFSEGVARRNLGDTSFDPKFKTIQGRAAWELYNAKTQTELSTAHDAQSYLKLRDSISIPELRSKVEMLPKGEANKLYSTEQWSNLNSVLTEQTTLLRAKFESDQAKFYEKAQPGERKTLIDPDTGKPTILTKPIGSQGGPIGVHADALLQEHLADAAENGEDITDPDLVARLRVKSFNEALEARRATGGYRQRDMPTLLAHQQALTPGTVEWKQWQVEIDALKAKERGKSDKKLSVELGKTRENPAKPLTPNDYNDLPPKSYFINPKDGKIYQTP